MIKMQVIGYIVDDLLKVFFKEISNVVHSNHENLCVEYTKVRFLSFIGNNK